MLHQNHQTTNCIQAKNFFAQNFSEKRMVFQEVQKNTPPPAQTLAQLATAIEAAKDRSYLNISAKFDAANPNATFEKLTTEANIFEENNKKPQRTTFDQIKNSIGNLAVGKDVQSLWKFLADNKCDTVLIKNGIVEYQTSTGEVINYRSFLGPLTAKIGGDAMTTAKEQMASNEQNTGINMRRNLLQEILASKNLAQLPKIPSSLQKSENTNQNIG